MEILTLYRALAQLRSAGVRALLCTVVAGSSCVMSVRADERPVFRPPTASDAAFLAGTTLLTLTTEVIIDTGEIEAHLPDDGSELLGIDAWVTRRHSSGVKRAQSSDVGVLALMLWAIADTALAGCGARPDSALTYASLYLESSVTTWLLSNFVKMAARRPRPRAYMEMRETGMVTGDTLDSLSFYSQHTALVASLSATATYLAFTREGPGWVRWLVFGTSLVATSVVGVGRMTSGAHFTTDVLAGLGAGIAVGVLVPHLHRATSVRLVTHIEPAGGGTLGVSAKF